MPLKDSNYYVKLRPGLREFLLTVEPLYEVHAYTMGTKAYCEGVTALLERVAGRQIFNEKVSREEVSIATGKSAVVDNRYKKQLDLFQTFSNSPDTVLAVDDNPSVWTDHAEHLVKIVPYYFFCSAENPNELHEQARREYEEGILRITDPQTPPLDDDTSLAVIQRVLQDVHRDFFLMPASSSVVELWRRRRESILRDCVICFSSLIPLHESDPSSTAVWQAAKSLGALVESELGPTVTHLVAGKAGTKKVHEAAARGIIVIDKMWLWMAQRRWERQPVEPYLLMPLPSEPQQAKHAQQAPSQPDVVTLTVNKPAVPQNALPARAQNAETQQPHIHANRPLRKPKEPEPKQPPRSNENLSKDEALLKRPWRPDGKKNGSWTPPQSPGRDLGKRIRLSPVSPDHSSSVDCDLLEELEADFQE